MESILKTIKQQLGVSEEYTVFDTDITIQINSAFMTLRQLGLGPDAGFHISGDTETWDQFGVDEPNLGAVKSLIYLKTKLAFDPPSSSFVIESFNRQIDELVWRLNVDKEEDV